MSVDLESRARSVAADLVEHPAWEDILRDVAREAKAARKAVFNEASSEREQSHARGIIKVLNNLVLGVYRRANKEVPPNIAALFE